MTADAQSKSICNAHSPRSGRIRALVEPLCRHASRITSERADSGDGPLKAMFHRRSGERRQPPNSAAAVATRNGPVLTHGVEPVFSQGCTGGPANACAEDRAPAG
jgi:hypothetical protein